MEYVVVKFPPEVAKRLVNKWYEDSWTHEEWQTFCEEVLELMAEELKNAVREK